MLIAEHLASHIVDLAVRKIHENMVAMQVPGYSIRYKLSQALVINETMKKGRDLKQDD